MSDEIVIPGGMGYIPSSVNKRVKHATQYAYATYLQDLYLPIVTAAVNVVTEWPDEIEKLMDQNGNNCCVAAETTKLQTILNFIDTGKVPRYDFWKAYCKACEIDKDNQTSCQADIGTYTWAGLDVLLNFGPWDIAKNNWDLDQGILKYMHITGKNVVDLSRTSLNYNQLINCGFPFFAGWLKDKLVYKYNKWFFPPRAQWGRQIGLHDMGLTDAVDDGDVFGITNTWGMANWPKKAYMNYMDYEWLMLEAGAESQVMVDKDPVVPPPPEPDGEEDVFMTIGDKHYSGKVRAV